MKWVISFGRQGQYAVDRPGMEKFATTAQAFQLSALGHYLIAPQPITVKRRLVGCQVHWKTAAGARRIPEFVRSLFKMKRRHAAPLTLLNNDQGADLTLSNLHLAAHVNAVEEQLRPYDALHQALARIDMSQVSRIVGLCQDRVGARSQLVIPGDPLEQLEFVKNYVAQEVPVQLDCARIADGLFELQGFDVSRWDPATAYPLLCMSHQKVATACVLNDDHTIAFWLDDPEVIGYLQLYEYCLQTHRHMRESLRQCLAGKAVPMRLMFNKAIEIDYSQAQLPAIFQEMVQKERHQGQMAQALKQRLNLHQMGISFNSLMQQGTDDGALCTDIAILQEMQALEPIRRTFPEVFQAVTRQSTNSRAGRFYLLDAIRGVDHDC